MPEKLLISYRIAAEKAGRRVDLVLAMSQPFPADEAYACLVSALPLVPEHRIYGDNPLQAVELSLRDLQSALLSLDGWSLSDERGPIDGRVLSPA